jgi:hypothetical protein
MPMYGRFSSPETEMAPDASSALSPKERLALSRRALVAQLHGEELPEEREERPAAFALPRAPQRGAERFAWASVLRSVTQRWWRRHPANAVGQLARPLLDRYAREQPAKLVAAAAATGALVVLIKPWRLLSITAVVAAVLKTSDVADLVTTLMQKNTSPRKDPP